MSVDGVYVEECLLSAASHGKYYSLVDWRNCLVSYLIPYDHKLRRKTVIQWCRIR